MAEKVNLKSNDSEVLSAFMHRMTRNEMIVFVDRLCKACMVPRYTVKYWSSRCQRIPMLYKQKIEEVAQAKIFE